MDWAQMMVFDSVGPSYFASSHEGVPDDGKRSCPVDAGTSSYVYSGSGLYNYDESGLAHSFSNIVHAADQPLWDGCNQSQLGIVAELVDMKANGDYYITKKLVKDLGYPLRRFMRVRMIACCTGKTTSIWSIANSVGTLGTSLLEGDTHTGRSSRMLSLEEGSMYHRSDVEAWKYFDRMYHDFPEKPCNIWLGVCTDSFAPHGQYGRTYSCWSVIITPYNLPPGAAAVVECGCENVGQCRGSGFHDAGGIDVDCERLTRLWNGVWVKYCGGYGMSALDRKWMKKSIFWYLPYWSTLLIRHNLDVMHIEKNVFDNIFNTVMDIKRKTKDNVNACRDLKIICNRPELELDERRQNVMPKAVYTLGKEQKRRVYEWIRSLKFPKGYASNLACCVGRTELRMHGMKSHDCHVFI
ncbi:hypothetical protein Sango_1582700 [Sesamum angolense]|uniref:Uncharacterized protein n=1 Tax=Sesamum angolense TaxID=2727404 RepID=A0AAE2BTR5_9LAMI|nr:hypothetical protein Sango_1582700 [Sesamum angolense]